MIDERIREIEEQAKQMIAEGQRLADLKDKLQKLGWCMSAGHTWQLGMDDYDAVEGNISHVFQVSLICVHCGSRVMIRDNEGSDVYYSIGNKVSDLLSEPEESQQEE